MTRRLDGERIRKANLILDFVAREFHGSLRRSLELDELRSLGTQGVALALREWDGRGVFEHFVAQRVRWAMIDELRRLARLTRREEARDELLAAAATQRAGETASLDTPPGTSAVLELARSAAAGYDLELDAAAVSGEGADDVERDAERMRLRRAVEGLPAPKREVIERHYYRGESFEELSAALGMSRSTAFDLHGRAIRSLREMFCPEPPGR